ncbi:MAG TPA: hypothetical protein VEI74_13180 [Candidatus Methylomirabilis sp.]|nr:hypothetical protein [Candidatus Methylomirabilis sp.]
MAESSKDTGVILALIERFESQRLPRAQTLKTKVDRGEVLSEQDLAFLNQVFEDAQHIRPLVHKHPEWQPLVARAVELYKAITERALANEKAAGDKPR